METDADKSHYNHPQSGSPTSMDYYWDSYAHFGIHEVMLKDSIRTLSYRMAIDKNSHLFNEKIVLDVGCGTGILSMFAAKAGAKKVIGVDASKIIESTREIIQANGLEDRITLIQGKIEEISLPVDQVDIIISEWMGYFLFYESMLSTVIFARDKWLAPNGALFPDKASLYLVGIEDKEYKEEKIDFWDNVYGFDMSCIKKKAYQDPIVDTVPEEAIVTTASKLMTVDLKTVQAKDLTWSANFELIATQKDSIHAFAAYFDVEFTDCQEQIRFSTAPDQEPTHWNQTIFYLKDVLPVNVGEVIKGKISTTPNAKNFRDLNISIEYQYEGSIFIVKNVQYYKMR
ncbi:uncharacterized protein LOC126316827 [Schistocerca gregaria]|uniref:uncharacterized protein LOC126316827 n=1 Tax=Schistocerca gregaria TaxID=7010 RepID=UPI00211E6FB6|nr:uncharacterized protein LOC126316827 [Schistocerca gregaria]